MKRSHARRRRWFSTVLTKTSPVGSLLRECATAEALPIVIDIGLFHRRLFFSALPGSTPDNIEWARRKRNVVERYHRSSYRVGRELAVKNDTLVNR